MLNFNVKLKNVFDFESYNAKEEMINYFLEILREKNTFDAEELFLSVDYAYKLIELTVDCGEFNTNFVFYEGDNYSDSVNSAAKKSGIDINLYKNIICKFKLIIKECYIESLKMYGAFELTKGLISNINKKREEVSKAGIKSKKPFLSDSEKDYIKLYVSIVDDGGIDNLSEKCKNHEFSMYCFVELLNDILYKSQLIL